MPLPDELLHPAQIAAYQRMTPAEKWHQAVMLYNTARALKTAAVKTNHPDWTPAKVEAHVREIFLHAQS